MARGFALFPRPFQKELSQGKQKPPYGDPPPEWPGSTAEWAVNWALSRSGEEFVYQQAFQGGRAVRGGAVVDFYLPARLIVIRVQGTYWHERLGVDVMASDQLQKAELESQGVIVVDIGEEQALNNTVWITAEAIAGRQHYSEPLS